MTGDSSITKPLADAEARRRIRGDLGATLLVEAAAGTGKTSELVARIVALVQQGRARLESVLAVTFTDKAAGEMKLRLRGELEKALRAEPEAVQQGRLTAALAQLEAAQIGTIHAVCSDLLRERPIEAGVDPLFEIAPDDVAERLYEEAFDGWFTRTLGDPPEGVRRVLRRKARGPDAEGARELLSDAGWRLCEHRDFDAPYRRDPFDRAGELARVLEALRSYAWLAERTTRKDGGIWLHVAETQAWVKDLERREALRGRDEDGLESELRELAGKSRSARGPWAWDGRGKWFCEGLERAAVVEQRDALKARLQAFTAAADRDLASCLRDELRPLVLAYEERKSRAGCLDFLDLLACAMRLVQRDPAVLADLRARYSHVLVDEFQDTDPLQAELLLEIAGGRPGAFFAVGDPKQSIYRFRRADLALYQDIKARLMARGAEVIFLSTSFRSAPEIQRAINAAFSLKMNGQPGQAAYVALDPHRADAAGQPAVIALPAPRLYGEKGRAEVKKWIFEESFADAAGAFVAWLVQQSGWTVTERDSGLRVPIEARHVCLLFKRLQSFGTDVARPYVEALEARGVRHVLASGKSYHAREEVLALRNAAAAIEWPDDEQAVFATLKGPLFAVSDDALLAFRGAHGRLHPLRDSSITSGGDGSIIEVAEALAVLGRLHRGRNRRPIADTLSQLLHETRAHAGLAIWPSGEQALANALRVIDLARRAESSGGALSFRSFVLRLEADEARGESGEAPAVEEGEGGVRIMSVHRAKGLEFPVVVLCDPGAPPMPRSPSRHVDPTMRLWAIPLAGCAPAELDERRAEVLERDRAETVRLAYVAATRARDLLVVPLVADEEPESWLEALWPAVYPKPEGRRRPEQAPGCPAFASKDVVLDRPDGLEMLLPIAPGLHAPLAGAHQLVVWDPRALDLGRETEGGLRRESLLEQDQGAVAKASLEAHDQWVARKASALAAGAVASLRVVTPTELAHEIDEGRAPALEAAARVRYEVVPGRLPHRPAGRRFGTLVHAVLAEASLAARRPAIDAVAAAQGRLIGATEDEVAAAAVAASAALAHPILRRAAASDDCRREAPLWLRAKDGGLVEGVADLAFREQGRWVVVDFKTDARPDERPGYAAQLALYCEAVAVATGQPAEGVLLGV